MAKSKERNFAAGNGTRAGGEITVVYTYWTNFSRDSAEEFQILRQDPKNSDYWWFKTNIEPDDLELFWDQTRKKRFLHQMLEIYWWQQQDRKEA